MKLKRPDINRQADINEHEVYTRCGTCGKLFRLTDIDKHRKQEHTHDQEEPS